MRFTSAVVSWAVAGALALGASGVAPAQEPPPSPPQPLILPGEPPDLLLFYTGDVLGYLTPCG